MPHFSRDHGPNLLPRGRGSGALFGVHNYNLGLHAQNSEACAASTMASMKDAGAPGAARGEARAELQPGVAVASSQCFVFCVWEIHQPLWVMRHASGGLFCRALQF